MVLTLSMAEVCFTTATKSLVGGHDGDAIRLDTMKTTIKELLAAVKEHVAIEKEEKRMLKQYPAGTCNAEDAWHDFGEREEASIVNLRRLAKCRA